MDGAGIKWGYLYASTPSSLTGLMLYISIIALTVEDVYLNRKPYARRKSERSVAGQRKRRYTKAGRRSTGLESRQKREGKGGQQLCRGKLVEARALPRTIVRTIGVNSGEVLEGTLRVGLHGLAALRPVGGAHLAVLLLQQRE